MSNKEQIETIKELRDALQAIRIRTINIAARQGPEAKNDTVSAYNSVFDVFDLLEKEAIENAVVAGELVWKE